MPSRARSSDDGGLDCRYRYARWDGAAWNDHELAHAGRRLYAREADYTGLVALDPGDPDVLFVSTDADPATGAPLISVADGRRHYEIFRGTTDDRGATWRWFPITQNSSVDNLRPVVPMSTSGDREPAMLLWLRGRMKTYTDYAFDVVGIVRRSR